MATKSTSSPIVIRSYQPSDLSACKAIFSKVHRDYDNPVYYIDNAQKTDMADIEKNYLEIPNGHWWVAVSTDDNRIVGDVAALPLSLGSPPYYHELPEDQRDQICELLRMAVASDVQKQDIGRKLLSNLISFARDKGYHQVHLTTLANMYKACAFYEKNGFIKGRIERFSFEPSWYETSEDHQKIISNRPKPTIFEVGATIPDEDQNLMKISPNQAKFIYIQHYSLMLQ